MKTCPNCRAAVGGEPISLNLRKGKTDWRPPSWRPPAQPPASFCGSGLFYFLVYAVVLAVVVVSSLEGCG